MDELIKQLETLRDNVQDITSIDTIILSDLFTDEFIKKHTDFTSFDAFFEHLGITQEIYDNTPNSELDVLIKENTNFDSWETFHDLAIEERIHKGL